MSRQPRQVAGLDAAGDDQHATRAPARRAMRARRGYGNASSATSASPTSSSRTSSSPDSTPASSTSRRARAFVFEPAVDRGQHPRLLEHDDGARVEVVEQRRALVVREPIHGSGTSLPPARNARTAESTFGSAAARASTFVAQRVVAQDLEPRHDRDAVDRLVRTLRLRSRTAAAIRACRRKTRAAPAGRRSPGTRRECRRVPRTRRPRSTTSTRV